MDGCGHPRLDPGISCGLVPRNQGTDRRAGDRIEGRASSCSAKRAAKTEQVRREGEQFRQIRCGERAGKANSQAVCFGMRQKPSNLTKIEMSEKRASLLVRGIEHDTASSHGGYRGDGIEIRQTVSELHDDERHALRYRTKRVKATSRVTFGE